MIVFKIEQVGEVLLRIYDSEINIELSSFWDGGYEWRIGDHINGFIDVDHIPKTPETNSVIDAISGLAFAVHRQYPQSDFADWYNALVENEKPHKESGIKQGWEFKNYRGNLIG